MTLVSAEEAERAAKKRMEMFDALPREYRDLANRIGLRQALIQMNDDAEIAAFERDHAS